MAIGEKELVTFEDVVPEFDQEDRKKKDIEMPPGSAG